MKRLLSKRSGFTLVEIIIAFAIFAIMASMIVQILNLMVRRKAQNMQFEKNLSTQEEQFIARTKDMTYDHDAEKDETLKLSFKDQSGAEIPIADIDYQLRNWDPEDAKNGINYFVGDYEYDVKLADSEHTGEEDPEEGEKDPANLGGSTQMSRFDTRITGTKGILTVKIEMSQPADYDPNVINVTVTVNDPNVAEVNKSHSQVSIFFAENKSGGKQFKVVSVNGGDKSQSSLKRVKLCGSNGVNVHCTGNGFGGGSETFTVEFEDDIDIADIGFGSNTTDGETYTMFKDGETNYFNIFGAYVKAGAAAPAPAEGDAESTEE